MPVNQSIIHSVKVNQSKSIRTNQHEQVTDTGQGLLIQANQNSLIFPYLFSDFKRIVFKITSMMRNI